VTSQAAVRLKQQLRALANPEDAAFLQRFFKTGPGEYGEGDSLLGIRVPALRKLAREHRDLPLPEILEVLRSPWHEERLLALYLLLQAFSKGDATAREEIYLSYLSHARFINNWDLVDASAGGIVGAYLWPENVGPLATLARSPTLWERRIAIVATLHFIRQGSFGPTIEISELLLRDPHDLIHKAVGWMLREVGKRDQEVLERFLRQHCREMPRTMLRYAIERFPAPLRAAYMSGAEARRRGSRSQG
jgi:3-methyladenine DNA glycosylase AlkD